MTAADFLDCVAENLGILAAGQTLDAESAVTIRRRMVGVFARLVREELTTVANTDDIPDAQSLALADIVAFDCAVPFQISGGKTQELAGFAEKALDSLRMVTSERPHKDTLSLPRWWGAGRRGTYTGNG